jgi:hypothetical protein
MLFTKTKQVKITVKEKMYPGEVAHKSSAMTAEQFTEEIKRWRFAKDAAAALGVTPQNIRRWRLGERAIPPYVGIVFELLKEIDRLKSE